MKTVRETVDDDILTKQYIFFGPTGKEKRELETGLIFVRANSSQQSRGRGSADNWAMNTLLKRASIPNKKNTAAS